MLKRFAVVFFVLSSPALSFAGTIADWKSVGSYTVDDKTATFISASDALNPTDADFSGGPTPLPYHLSNGNLDSINVSTTLRFSITITGSPYTFAGMRVSENDTLGNTTAGSTTTVYTDAGFSNQIASFTLLGTQSSAVSYAAAGLTKIYVQEVITGVDAGLGNLSSIDFDVTQSAVPEPTTLVSMAMGIAVAGFARLRRRSATV